MPVLRSASGLVLRSTEAADVPLLARWRSDPRILEFYGGRDKPRNEDAVRRRYFGRRRDPATGRFYEYRACIVEADGLPVAFVQYYRPPKHEARLFRCSPGERTYGIDFLIGDPTLWGRGLGTRFIGLLRDYLRETRGASRIVSDPMVENLRSVRALEKAGFHKVLRLNAHAFHEGIARDCWLMEFS